MSNFMTAIGLEKLKKHLAEIKEQLKDVAIKIKEAKDLGDLSENAEYHEAKNHQAFLYGKELELEEKIKNAQVVAAPKGENIAVGSKVEVSADDEVDSYEIVGTDESDPLKGLISLDSPIGSALVGHKKGDKVKVSTPSGTTEFKIISVK
ncbi:MAG: transcription elongation factor GreA [bacterium]